MTNESHSEEIILIFFIFDIWESLTRNNTNIFCFLTNKSHLEEMILVFSFFFFLINELLRRNNTNIFY